jgi:histidinol dehydrogenase
MTRIEFPERSRWPELTRRPAHQAEVVGTLVDEVFSQVRKFGDNAVRNYTLQFDKADISELEIAASKLEGAHQRLEPVLVEAIGLAARNIEMFHASQAEAVAPVQTMPGVTCWRESRPIEKVGIYIPGGSAPLFSTVLMLAIPAVIAGCREIILCTPPGPDGEVHPAILYAARLTGVSRVFRIGGMQAIAAMSVGTETVPPVHKIFGPGNQYVTAAKQKAFAEGVAIDLPAGPSEVLIIADHTANPDFVAADLLSQAEHGEDSQVVLISNDFSVIDRTFDRLKKQLEDLPRRDIAEKALLHSRFIVLKDLSECVEFSNAYAPEHLILQVESPGDLVRLIQHAGSVFLGRYSCESAGDYASGTNHTLPTNGYARAYSGVSLDSFVRKITFQELSAQGLLNLGPAIEVMAEAEQLMAHRNAVSVRLKSIENARS